MLRFFVLLVALLAAQSQAEKRFYALEDAQQHFEEFIATFNRQYADEAEKNFRFNIFKENLIKLNEHNRNQQAEFGVNKFTDLSAEEFKQKYTGLRGGGGLSGPCSPAAAEPSSNASAPDSFDWRSKGAVTPVKDQASCGSCWAFSVTGNIEAQYFIKNGNQVLLSEQQLVDCARASGCSGGTMDETFAYVVSNGGIMSESDYPYTAVDGICYFNQSRVAARLSGCKDYWGYSEDQLKDTLVRVGPLSIGVDANVLQNYNDGIVDCGGPGTINHAVLLVGYGNENGHQYWIIKNSWGASWGEQGYYRLAYGTNSCSVATSVSSSIIA